MGSEKISNLFHFFPKNFLLVKDAKKILKGKLDISLNQLEKEICLLGGIKKRISICKKKKTVFYNVALKVKNKQSFREKEIKFINSEAEKDSKLLEILYSSSSSPKDKNILTKNKAVKEQIVNLINEGKNNLYLYKLYPDVKTGTIRQWRRRLKNN